MGCAIILLAKKVHGTYSEKVPVCYFVNSNNVLMRKWWPPNVPASQEWRVVYQIVVPPSYRRDVLVLAHGTPLAGHLGVEKTYHKVLGHFYWPGLHGDVKRFCKTCHVCQLAGKPNQHPPVTSHGSYPSYGGAL